MLSTNVIAKIYLGMGVPENTNIGPIVFRKTQTRLREVPELFLQQYKATLGGSSKAFIKVPVYTTS